MWGRVILTAVVVVLVAIWLAAIWLVLTGGPTRFRFKLGEDLGDLWNEEYRERVYSNHLLLIGDRNGRTRPRNFGQAKVVI
jgi:hypothetical protein